MTTKTPASNEKLSGIHDSLATWCTAILQGKPLLNDEGRAVLKEDGQPWLLAPTAAELNIVRQFLKDNQIDSTPKATNPLGVLQNASSLPFGDSVVPFKKSIQ